MALYGVNEVGSTSTYRNSNVPTSSANSVLSLSDFYTLLAAQLKYQDADNPMDTSEMMASMVQTQMIEAITQMTSMNTTSYATSMVGKEVTIAMVDKDGMYAGEKKGVVTGVVLGDNPIIFVDGAAYSLSQIVAVGEIPEQKDPDEDDSQQKPQEPGTGDNSDDGGTESAK